MPPLLALPSYRMLSPMQSIRHLRFPDCSRRKRCVLYKMEAPTTTARRQTNYQPSLWSHDYIQSLPNSTKDAEANAARIASLKEIVKKNLLGRKEMKDQLELIDTLQQLGVAYHFKKEIKDVLCNIHRVVLEEGTSLLPKDDLYFVSLLFRLLRQQGFTVSEDIFECFGDEKGRMKDMLHHRAEGVLGLYEASHLAMEGESELDEATEATRKHLELLLQESALETHLRERVKHALDVPLHWRIPRLHTRWFLEVYQKRPNMDPHLLELAKLDFNVLQKLYLEELKQLSWWYWRDLGIGEKPPFPRERLVESYFWAMSVSFEPQLSSCRVAMTKANCLVAVIDDLYDIYGTLDELELFTNAVDTWEDDAIKTLPEYMEIFFLAIFNTINDIAYEVLKEKGWNVIPHLKTAWADFCKAMLVESKWYHQGHTPKLQEYLDNAWMSSGGQVSQIAACCSSKDLFEGDLETFTSHSDLLLRSSMILRLCNDLATSTAELERGDVAKAVNCYMKEKGVSEERACKHVKELIRSNWRALNGNLSSTSPSQEYLRDLVINFCRIVYCIYQHGDGYGKPDGETKDRIITLLMEPVSM